MKIQFYLIIFCIVTSCFSSYAINNITDNDDTLKCFSESQYVYWYYTTIKVIKRQPKDSIKYKISKIKGGTLLGYEKDLWRNLQGGQSFPVGPFIDPDEAEESNMIYCHFAKGTKPNIEQNDTVFWMRFNYRFSPRSHKMELNCENKIISGTKTDFYNDLQKGIFNTGPFKDRQYLEQLYPKRTGCSLND